MKQYTSRTRVKICGITRVEDALLAESLGVDALGFVFVPASARCVALADARHILGQLSGFVTPVGLFLDADAGAVNQVLEALPTLVPQFHGRESAAYCEQFGRPYIKALGVAAGMPQAGELAAFTRACGFLLDSHAPGELGGTGKRFDWDTIEGQRPPSLILAGGLKPDNVKQAIADVEPYAVDVSSGVEQARGVKDAALMRAFMAAVGSASASASERH